ncbi:hypothetical protein [Mycobacterium sp. MMS18-G62]
MTMTVAEPITSLLQRHLAGEDISGQVAEMVGGDPQLAAVAQMLAERQSGLESQLDAYEDDGAEEPVVTEARQERAEELRAQWEHLSVELERLCTTLDEVAAALGACPRCLGADVECALCHGRSGPGTLPPDALSFNRIVLPAVRAHSYSRSRKVRDRECTTT